MNKGKPTKTQLALGKKAVEAMKIAVRKAIREKMRAGLPVYVARDGKVVNLNPDKRPAA
jgi:hypothetical protein